VAAGTAARWICKAWRVRQAFFICAVRIDAVSPR